MKKLISTSLLSLCILLSFGQTQSGTYDLKFGTTIIRNTVKLPNITTGATTDSILVKKPDGRIYKIAVTDIIPLSPTRISLGVDQTNNTLDINKPISSFAQTALNSKVANSRTLTINGTTLDLSVDRAWTISGMGTPQYNISQLQAVASVLSGFLFINDLNRQGLFYVDPVDNTTAADNGVVFVTAGGQRIKRVYTGAVNLAWFGLINNDVPEANSIDQRLIIRDVLWANRYNTYYIPKGTYWVSYPAPGAGNNDNNSGSLPLQSNTHIIMDTDCIIKMIGQVHDNPILFNGRYKDNIIIEGGQLVGDRYNNTAPLEFGALIQLSSSRNVTIKGTRFKESHGDAMYIIGGESKFLLPDAPASQIMTGLTIGLAYRVDVIGSGTLTLTDGSGWTEVITNISSRHISMPSASVTATITGVLTQVYVDSPSYNFVIDNVKTFDCRRNGISIIACVNFTISNSRFEKCNGKDPQSGIDLEQNFLTQRVWNGQITNCISNDNKNGFDITGHNIVLSNCASNRNVLRRGYNLANVLGASGDIFINNCTSNDDGQGLSSGGGKKLFVNGLSIRNTVNEAGFKVGTLNEAIINNLSVFDTHAGGIELSANIPRASLSNITVEKASRGLSGGGFNLLSSNTTLNNFKIINGGHNGLTLAPTASNVIISNGIIDGNARVGASLVGTNVIFGNTIVQNNSVAGAADYSNISIGASTNVRVTNNIIRKGASSPKYGIEILSTAVSPVILNNDLNNATALAVNYISDLSTSTIYDSGYKGDTRIADLAYSQVFSDSFIAFSSLTLSRAVTLLAPSAWKGKTVQIKDESNAAGTNNITIVGTVDGIVNPVAVNTNNGVSKTYYSNGTAIFTK